METAGPLHDEYTGGVETDVQKKTDQTGPKMAWWLTWWVRMEKEAEEANRPAKTTNIITK